MDVLDNLKKIQVFWLFLRLAAAPYVPDREIFLIVQRDRYF